MVVKSDFSIQEKDVPSLPVKDWLLIVIHDKDDQKPKDVLSIINEIFIFAWEVLPSIKSDFEFRTTCAGPYSEKIMGALKQLLSDNLLEKKENGSSPGGEHGYVLTEKGRKKAEKIASGLPKTAREKMEFVKNTISHMGPIGMMQYIYSIYPQYVFLNEGGEFIE